MKDIKADENHIEHLASKTKQLIIILNNLMVDLENKDSDLFIRYLSYSTLSNVIRSLDLSLELAKNLFSLGHDSMSEIFDTVGRKKHQWNEFKLHLNPFFENSSDDDDNNVIHDFKVDDLIEFLKCLRN